MNCQNHPHKEGIANCFICGKTICNDCILNIAGKKYCHECVTRIISEDMLKRELDSEKSMNNRKKDNFSQHNNITNRNKNHKLDDENNLEEKYEKYLDDIYYGKKNEKQNEVYTPNDISLKEQLVKSKINGIITKKSYDHVDTDFETLKSHHKKRKNQKRIHNKKEGLNKEVNYRRPSLHPNIHEEKIEEDSKKTEIILSIILILMVILVSSYIIFLLTLSDHYLSFFDAIYAFFIDPNGVINNIIVD